METQKIINLLNDSSNEESKFRFETETRVKTRFESETVKSSPCDYSNAFILVTGHITANAANNTDVVFKNCAPFSSCTNKN